MGVLSLKIEAGDLQAPLKKKLNAVAAKAQVKGFRPGKVPVALVEKMYGPSLKVEVINEMIDDSVNGYIKDNSLDILGQPMPSKDTPEFDFESASAYEFKFDIGLAPAFEIPAFDSITVNTYKPRVDDARVEEFIQELLERFGETTNPDKAEQGDFIYGLLAKEDGTWNTKTAIPTNKLTDAGKKAFIGSEKEQTISFDLASAFDAHELRHVTGLDKEGVAAISGTYTFHVENINRTSKGTLNEEFYKKVFPREEVSDAEAFKALIRENLVKGSEADAKNFQITAVRQTVTKSVAIDLPAEFLKRWFLSQKDNKVTAEQLDRDWHLYERDLKWTLISNKIAEKADFKISREEMEEVAKDQIRSQFAQYGLPIDDEDLLSEYAKQYLSDNKGKNVREMYEEAFARKVIDHITSQVNIVEAEATSEEMHHHFHTLEDGWKA